MTPFTVLQARAAPLLRANVDTDQIIRIDRLIDHPRGELGPYCLEALRTRADGSADPAFAPATARYRGAAILLAGANFGCGSSREHAVWALQDYGLRVIVAESFGDIFYGNAFQNGLLLVRLPAAEVAALGAELERCEPPQLTVDLHACRITTPGGRVLGFDLEPERRAALLAGLDEIGFTLQHAGRIAAFRAADEAARPWIYRTTETRQLNKLLILAGDGIGPEIMAQTRRVVDWFAEHRGLPVQVREEAFGIAAWQRYRDLMPDATWQAVADADAILFGAIGSPEYEAIPAEQRKTDPLLRMRRELDLYINLRPVRALPALAAVSSLRPEVLAGTDLVLVRELAGGIYFGTPRGIEVMADGSRRAVNTLVYGEREIERIARAAFELARTRSGRVCSVDKGNVLENGALWRATVTALQRAEYPDVELSHLYVDNAAMQLVRDPRQFDVVVTDNLFGDILSDCAAMVAGSIGMLPSASLNAPGSARRSALYEPIHGSAPDIAGQGVANPLGSMLSFALCLRHSLGQAQQAAFLEAAVERVVTAGVRTRDIAVAGAATVSTAQMGDAVLRELDRSRS